MMKHIHMGFISQGILIIAFFLWSVFMGATSLVEIKCNRSSAKMIDEQNSKKLVLEVITHAQYEQYSYEITSEEIKAIYNEGVGRMNISGDPTVEYRWKIEQTLDR